MQTYQAIETEVAHRRGELKREAAMDARAALARPERGSMRWRHVWRRALARLCALSAPRGPRTSWQPTVKRRGLPNTVFLPEDAPI